MLLTDKVTQFETKRFKLGQLKGVEVLTRILP